jgi:transposase-like protein
MSVTPKSSWPWMRTLLHFIFDQPGTETVVAQSDRVLDALSDKLLKVAEHLDAARADLLALTAFPKDLAPNLVAQYPGSCHAGAPSAPNGGSVRARTKLEAVSN